MKKYLQYFFIFSFMIPAAASAQFESYQDSVVQFYGVLMSADSLRALPRASVTIMSRNQGTVSNDEGVFSIVVLKGDSVEFSSVGYKPKIITIPRDLKSNQYSVIQLMVQDEVYLPATVVPHYPTPQEFARDFVNTKVPDDKEEIIRKNLSEANRRALMSVYPMDGREASQNYMRQNVRKYYSAGQLPPQNIFNPLAWAEFIKAWKRGDFRNKK